MIRRIAHHHRIWFHGECLYTGRTCPWGKSLTVSLRFIAGYGTFTIIYHLHTTSSPLGRSEKTSTLIWPATSLLRRPYHRKIRSQVSSRKLFLVQSGSHTSITAPTTSSRVCKSVGLPTFDRSLKDLDIGIPTRVISPIWPTSPPMLIVK